MTFFLVMASFIGIPLLVNKAILIMYSLREKFPIQIFLQTSRTIKFSECVIEFLLFFHHLNFFFNDFNFEVKSWEKKFIVWFHRKSQSNERNFGLKSLEFHDGALIESLLVLVFALFVFVSQIVIPNYSTFNYSNTQNK